MAGKSVTYSWLEAARAAGPELCSAPDEADIATVVMYARNFGIGRPVSHQKAEYSRIDLAHLTILLKWWTILLNTCNLSISAKPSTRALVRCLAQSITTNRPLPMLAVFCPSYKLGAGQIGFGQSIGEHTLFVTSRMVDFLRMSAEAGLHTQMEVYFSDLLLENYDLLKGTNYRHDLALNYESFQSRLRESGVHTLSVQLLSSLPEIVSRVGEQGVYNPNGSRDQGLFRHVLLRNKAFYSQQLGWSDERTIFRTTVLYDSYAEIGRFFRSRDPNYVMYWTESAYERAPLYSTALDASHPLPVIYPRKPC
jgi:hypothetical protein